ncbi:hypothetical protein RUM43_012015 [Polyplax serrata]|uniref:Uncharacterized protein n=1 Tax=Polyplax serrata TaxID=468196 RepID=A0AAN8PJ93_POLSC
MVYQKFLVAPILIWSTISNNQKLERPPCGSTAHAVVHNAHSAHAALPGHVMCGPMQRPGCHLKKGTVRGNGDVLKRSRIQTALVEIDEEEKGGGHVIKSQDKLATG